MRTPRYPLAIVLALFGLAGPAGSLPAPAAGSKEIASLVKRLGNPDPQTREEAFTRLTAMGPGALPSLRGAARTENADLKKQVAAAITAIGRKGKEQLERHLAKLHAAGAVVTQEEEPALTRLFPTGLFYAVIFRQYPIARRPPQPLQMHNIFVYGKDTSLQRFSDVQELTKLFRAHLASAKNDTAIKDVTRGWLAIVKEFHQDGFYGFTIPKDVTITPQDGGKKAVGRAVVKPVGGNKGYVQAALVFDASGKLTKIAGLAKLKPGIRPVCQATKLLDADPIIRRMAEKDILVMGRAAKDYLDEQRRKASPALQKAIDRVWKRIVDEGW
jgi:hypothetical protein